MDWIYNGTRMNDFAVFKNGSFVQNYRKFEKLK